MNQQKQAEEAKLKESSIIKELREEIANLKKWKESAIIETVDKDRFVVKVPFHFDDRHWTDSHSVERSHFNSVTGLFGPNFAKFSQILPNYSI